MYIRWVDPPQRSELGGGVWGSARAYHTMTFIPPGSYLLLALTKPELS